MLARLGIHTLGLYAARTFKRGATVGRYEGTVVGTFETRAALESDTAKRLVHQMHDKLITRQRPTGGVDLIDGHTQGPPFLSRVNDPWGTPYNQNVIISPGGYMRVVAASIPRFSFDRPLRENLKAELKYSYGQEYWRAMALLGKTSDHAILVE